MLLINDLTPRIPNHPLRNRHKQACSEPFNWDIVVELNMKKQIGFEALGDRSNPICRCFFRDLVKIKHN